MFSNNFYNIFIFVGIIFVVLVIIGIIIVCLYCCFSKEIFFVCIGFGGEKVILGGGVIVLFVLYEIIFVNMNMLCLEVCCVDD